LIEASAVGTAGNVIGGIVIVTLLNFGLTAGGEREHRMATAPRESA
jgi:formate/nitrite transporter FocA (FNT family)